jgi:response regulator NasT
VVILDDHERSRADLRAAIGAAGGEVAGEALRCADVRGLLRDARPDVAVVAVGLPDGDGVAAAAEATGAGSCPVVLFTSHTGDELVERALAAGVMAFLLKPLQPGALAPTLDIAIARFREAQDLRQRLEERKVIERAKGVLMSRYGLAEDQAYRRLRRAAMDTRRPMADVAREVLTSESVLHGLLSD